MSLFQKEKEINKELDCKDAQFYTGQADRIRDTKEIAKVYINKSCGDVLIKMVEYDTTDGLWDKKNKYSLYIHTQSTTLGAGRETLSEAFEVFNAAVAYHRIF